jgi:4-aminobutyrate aminotransferase/(S)-3-amino-2-methylpropionate transaminase
VAAIIAEPVLGEGGFIVPPADYFKILRGICDKYGILLIADEVQTGLARTGKMFACEHFGIEPDLLLTAKTLGGGLPLAAVTGKDYIMDHTGPGALGGTFGGNPLACEAALATLDTIELEGLCERGIVLGDRFRRRAEDWQRRFSLIGEIRGLGAMQAIELVRDRDSRAPASEETERLAQYCAEHGVILLTTGSYGNVIRLLMPLVISNDEFDEALSVVESGFEAVLEPQTAHRDPVHA